MLPARPLAALLVTGSLAMTGAVPVATSLAANNPPPAMRAMTHQVRRHHHRPHCREVRRHGVMVRVCRPRHHHHDHRRGVMTP
jgi:hypothetical protein